MMSPRLSQGAHAAREISKPVTVEIQPNDTRTELISCLCSFTCARIVFRQKLIVHSKRILLDFHTPR